MAVPSVEFGRRQVANEIRNRLDTFLDDDDSRRSKTIELQDRVPDEVVQRVREEAADSRQAEANKSGQASLTDRERREIDFSKDGVNVPYARSVKGIAQSEGVEDWIQFSDFDITVDENRSVLERAGREERGARGRGRSQEQTDLQKGQQAKRQRRQQAEGAKAPAFGGDAEAAEFLREESRFEDDLFDISLRGSSPSGSDHEKLQDAHNDRSERAQRVDERRSAKVTRDPLEWSQNKSTLDFPGIDTVQPQKLHDQRSKRARRVDEEEQAPIADSREQWAQSPDQYDWKGVDTKQRSSIGEMAERAQEMQSARMDATMRHEPMTKTDDLEAQARSRGISFDPDLDLGAESEYSPAGSTPTADVADGFAAGREADMAFISAEEDRGGDPYDMSAENGLMTDDRDQQASLDVGRAAGVTEDRSGKVAGSAGFEDKRDELRGGSDPGEQAGLIEEELNVGGDGQMDLLGDDATESTGGEFLK